MTMLLTRRLRASEIIARYSRPGYRTFVVRPLRTVLPSLLSLCMLRRLSVEFLAYVIHRIVV